MMEILLGSPLTVNIFGKKKNIYIYSVLIQYPYKCLVCVCVDINYFQSLWGKVRREYGVVKAASLTL